MKLLTGFNSLVCCGFLIFCPVANSFAQSGSDYAASISYTSNSQAASTVYNSYRQLYTLEGKLESLSQYAINAVNSALNSEDFYYLDVQFQAQKQRIDTLLNQSVMNFKSISESEYFIDMRNDGQGNHLKFHLNLNALDKQIWTDQVTTVEDAQQAIHDIDTMLKALYEMLPSNMEHNDKNANHDLIQTGRKLNEFKIAKQEDSDALLKSLIHLHDQLSSNLLRLRELAVQAVAADSDVRDEINEEFQAYLSVFRRAFSASSIGEVKLFNDNQLKLYVDGKVKNYYFPRIDLEVLNLANTDVLARENAIVVLSNVIAFYEWLEQWSVTGKSPLKYRDQINNQLSKLSPKERENLLDAYIAKYKI